MSKILIVLHNAGGELDRQVIEVPHDDDTVERSHAILEALEAWTLSSGDVIQILEVES